MREFSSKVTPTKSEISNLCPLDLYTYFHLFAKRIKKPINHFQSHARTFRIWRVQLFRRRQSFWRTQSHLFQIPYRIRKEYLWILLDFYFKKVITFFHSNAKKIINLIIYYSLNIINFNFYFKKRILFPN